MHPAQIKADLEIAGYSQSDLARQLGVKPNTVGYVVHGRGRSERIERRISALIKRPLQEIWPQWYAPRSKRFASNQPSALAAAG